MEECVPQKSLMRDNSQTPVETSLCSEGETGAQTSGHMNPVFAKR